MQRVDRFDDDIAAIVTNSAKRSGLVSRAVRCAALCLLLRPSTPGRQQPSLLSRCSCRTVPCRCH